MHVDALATCTRQPGRACLRVQLTAIKYPLSGLSPSLMESSVHPSLLLSVAREARELDADGDFANGADCPQRPVARRPGGLPGYRSVMTGFISMMIWTHLYMLKIATRRYEIRFSPSKAGGRSSGESK